jgi:hypothetical protein
MNLKDKPDDQDSFQEYFEELHKLPAPRPDLAESIFAQTRGVLTRRRWFRRGRVAAICVSCYVVGICSGWVLKPATARQVAGWAVEAPQGTVIGPDESEKLALSQEKTPLSDGAIQQVPMPPKPAGMAAVDPSANPVDRKPDATGTPLATVRPATNQFENFRRAGDRQLFERGNVENAMECYRRALTHATDRELNIEVDRDSWLLMSLKQSRMEGRKHVRPKRA